MIQMVNKIKDSTEKQFDWFIDLTIDAIEHKLKKEKRAKLVRL